MYVTCGCAFSAPAEVTPLRTQARAVPTGGPSNLVEPAAAWTTPALPRHPTLPSTPGTRRGLVSA
eukprot:6077747-Alexandrium_andersonii.AAC.1